VNVVIPPVALDGPVLTIRKFSVVPLSVEDLISFGTASREVFEFLYGAVMAGLNIIVSGGSSSGKTTLLNVLSGFVPENERIVTIENAAELQLRQRHVVRMESRPPNIEEEGEITIRDLVINSLRMRPDRIVVGEVRSAEAIDLLQAMNTGHEGSMGTLHANSPHDALSRLETMVLGAGLDLPVRAIREQMASAINLLIQMGRDRNGVRRILVIAEVEGMEMDTISLSDLFRFERVPGSDRGRLVATGIIPRTIDRIADAGVRLSPALFEPPAWVVPSYNIPTIQSSDNEEVAYSDNLQVEQSLATDSQVEIAALPSARVPVTVPRNDEPMTEVLALPEAECVDPAPVEDFLCIEEAELESPENSESPCLPETGHGLLSHLRHDDQTDLEPENSVTNEPPCLPETGHGLLSHLRHDDQPDDVQPD
jgi:type IV secretory pathway ATPase VirB11/archaellum biosynthesis ATPase